MSTRSKLLLLGSLYFSQGLPYGFFTVALPVLLRQQGLSLPQIGLSGLLFLPWAFKFGWAPWIDAVRAPKWGKRRAVIIPLQLASIAVLLALSGLGSARNTVPLFIGVLFVNVLSATQDIATDGMAVEVLDANERGLGNGLQVGAYRIGMILGGGVMLSVFARWGWTAAFIGLALLLCLASLKIFTFQERTAVAGQEEKGGTWLRKGLGRWALVLVAYKAGEWFAGGMLKAFLHDSGQTLEQIGLMLGTAGSTAGLVGAMLGGWLTPKLGRRRALLTFGVIQAVGVGSFAVAVIAPSTAMFYALTVIEHVVSGLATAALFTAMMDCCRPDHAGSDYTVQASLVVVAAGAAAALSGYSAEAWAKQAESMLTSAACESGGGPCHLSAQALGYGGHFLLAGVLCLLGVVAVWLYRANAQEFTLLSAATPASRPNTLA
ncbi:MAG: MFS transporter [Myxococcaceae bacterium]